MGILKNTLVAEEGLELTRLSHGYDRVNRESSNPVVYKVGDKRGMDPPMPLAAASLWRIWNELSDPILTFRVPDGKHVGLTPEDSDVKWSHNNKG